MTQAGKHLYFVSNWKSHKSLNESLEFLVSFKFFTLPVNCEIILCPPCPYLIPIAESIKDQRVPLTLGTQDISPFPFGAYTGAVAAPMVVDYCRYVITGHSERRKYFGETNETVGKKVRQTLEAGMTPIVCIDEPYLETQLAFFTKEEIEKMIIAYEPLAAIGSGTPDTPEHAQAIAQHIKQLTDTDVPVLYGGSVSPESVADFVNREEINGVLVGGASLEAETWKHLIQRGAAASAVTA